MLSIRQFAVMAAFLAAPLLATGSSQAQHWPNRTVRLITPNTVGSGGDLTARIFAEHLTARWGRPVIVENRQGADGILAVTSFLGARDDHTLLFSPA
jgi:tripartite-type tricarboxylate transporter receptor subunit TctC